MKNNSSTIYKCIITYYNIITKKHSKKYYSSKNRKKIFAIYYNIKNKINTLKNNIICTNCSMYINRYKLK